MPGGIEEYSVRDSSDDQVADTVQKTGALDYGR